MPLNKLTDEQRKFLELTLKLHNDITCDYENYWSQFTKGVMERGEYSDNVIGSLNKIGDDFKQWRQFRKVFDDDLPF